MLRKLFLFSVLVSAVLFTVISCSQKGSCLTCPSKIKMTPTQTATPDAPYTVYLHEESTPMANVGVTLIQPTAGVTLTGTTGKDGKFVFNVHDEGQWELDIGGYDGFEGQKFMVEPVTNTYNSINYGIPSLETDVVSGSESIPIGASTIVYKVVYHTKYPRPVMVHHDTFDNLVFSSPSNSGNLRVEGDTTNYTLNVPKSYEGYPTGKTLPFNFYCTPLNGSIIYSPQRILAKNWEFSITADYIYAAVKAYDEDSGHTSYLAGVKNIILFPGNYVPHGNIVCEIYSAVNTGDAGPGNLVSSGYGCFRNDEEFGCYTLLAKLTTDTDEDFAYSHPDNNGTLILRIHDNSDGDLDIKRSFHTNNAWSNPCYYWCCSSRDISASRRSCSNGSKPSQSCDMWDKFRIAFIFKDRFETITSSSN
jgi:hypothetical protein